MERSTVAVSNLVGLFECVILVLSDIVGWQMTAVAKSGEFRRVFVDPVWQKGEVLANCA